LDDLAEIAMGAWAGLDRAEIDRRWPGPPDEDMLAFYDRAPGGEGLARLFARAGRVVAALDRPTVVFTHGMTSRALRAVAMGWGIGRLNDLPGGQGVVYRVRGGSHGILEP
jgi:probable phosphoglycerate mutase